jgi:prepilin-type N-terminal cleavage/methylation domain-containing protein
MTPQLSVRPDVLLEVKTHKVWLRIRLRLQSITRRVLIPGHPRVITDNIQIGCGEDILRHSHTNTMKKALTLIELMVVVIIIGVLATLGITQFSRPRERMIENEAKATLKLIAAAQKVYRMEMGRYINATNTTRVNEQLRLRIGNSSNWNYTVDINPGGTQFRANATRIGNASKVYYIDQSLENATQ